MKKINITSTAFLAAGLFGAAVSASAQSVIAPGAPAQLVVLAARSFSELLSRPGAPRRLVDGEELRAAHPPDFAELAGPA